MLLSSGIVPAQLDVISPVGATAGQKTAVTVKALDNQGNVLSNFAGTIRFTSSDAKAQLPSQYTFTATDHGIHTFGAILDTAGRESITATDAADAVSGKALLVVTPGVAHMFRVTAPSSTTAGKAVSLTVAALDAYGNLATGYRGTVSFSSSDPKAQRPHNYTFTATDNGRHTFTLTLDTAGKDSVNVTDTAHGSITGKTSLTVAPATAIRFVMVDNTTSASGQSLLAVGFDAYGNEAVVTHYTLSDGVLSQNGITFDTGVDSFVIASNGHVVTLHSLGLVYETSPWVSYDRFIIGSGVVSITVAADGNVRMENSSGTWYEETTTYQWTFDVDHPTAAAPYSVASGPLFGANGPSYLDVEQGSEGDCWLLASLAEVAARAPSMITSMFTYDGIAVENNSVVNVYTVRFYDHNTNADRYVVVDTELPDGGGYYDRVNTALGSTVLWVALAEKAYAQANGAGFVTTSKVGSDSYDALNGEYPYYALQAISGRPAFVDTGFNNASEIATAWNQGQFIVLATGSPSSSYIVGDHAYAVVGYNPSSSMPYELFNPWGTDANGWAPGQANTIYGLFFANDTFVVQNFDQLSQTYTPAAMAQGPVKTGHSVVPDAAKQLDRGADVRLVQPLWAAVQGLRADDRQ